MENFISSFVFILPGLMAYFWLQAFGLNPPVKHTAPEVTGIAALLWIPISFGTLAALNSWAYLFGDFNETFRIHGAWTINEMKTVTGDIRYVCLFICTSAIISFIICFLWGIAYNHFLELVINPVRKCRKIAKLGKMTTVWDDFFSNDNPQVVKIQKLEKENEQILVGSVLSFSRPFEPDKALILDKVSEWEKELIHYDYPTNKIYVDIKTGVIIKELDLDNPTPRQKITS